MPTAELGLYAGSGRIGKTHRPGKPIVASVEVPVLAELCGEKFMAVEDVLELAIAKLHLLVHVVFSFQRYWGYHTDCYSTAT